MPENPLSKFSTYEIKHIMAAFKYTEDAEDTKLIGSSGKVGENIEGTTGIIIVNEFMDDRFIIPSVMWKWSKYSHISKMITSLFGYIIIHDRTGGQFLDWYKTNVIDKLEISTQYMTFVLQTYFIGRDKTTDKTDTVIATPLLFHVHNFSDTMNIKQNGTNIKLILSAAYNTTAQFPTICKPYQITVTHRDGQLSNIAPEILSPGCSLEFREIEDSKFEDRTKRLNKSKPMRTLKEAFDAFEFDLNQQSESHKRQVQDWLNEIRNDYSFKIDPPPKQKRGEELPIKFHLKLDPIYNSYKLDNRNLPFEQTEENRDLPGITSIPFKSGDTIIDMIKTIMSYSINVGKDADTRSLSKSFKINLAYRYEKDNKIHVYIKIKQILLPFNNIEFGDTGAGEGPTPLEFTFKSGKLEDIDIIYFKTDIQSDNGIIPLEVGEKFPIFGNREPIMGERIPSTAPDSKFTKSEYSGLRVPIFPHLINGVEDMNALANIFISYAISNEQASNHEIQILGNPDLMSDLQRLPKDAINLNPIGHAKNYKMPESYPMYLKIKIYIEKDAVIGLIRSENLPAVYYYDKYYEISSILNDMTSGTFTQLIELKKTDGII
jgi:hypothetical protein